PRPNWPPWPPSPIPVVRWQATPATTPHSTTMTTLPRIFRSPFEMAYLLGGARVKPSPVWACRPAVATPSTADVRVVRSPHVVDARGPLGGAAQAAGQHR